MRKKTAEHDFGICTHTVAIQFSYSSHTVTTRLPYSSHTVPTRLPYSSHTVPTTFPHGCHIVPIQLAYSSHTVPIRSPYGCHSPKPLSVVKAISIAVVVIIYRTADATSGIESPVICDVNCIPGDTRVGAISRSYTAMILKTYTRKHRQ